MMIDRLKELSPGAWAALCTVIASGALIVIFAPVHFWDSLSKADPGHIAGVIGLVVAAVIAPFTRGAIKTPAPTLAAPVLPDDDVDTVPIGPRRSPRNGGQS